MSLLKQILLFSLLPLSLLSLLLFLLPLNHHHNHHHNHHFPLPSPLLNPFPPPPRIAYFITGTDNDGPRIFRLLQAIYHPRNYYLLHLDQYASRNQRVQLALMVASVDVFVAAENVNVVEKANAVNEQGSSSLSLMLHGAAILLRWKKDWDWFVNLDASDYPLLPQDDFLHVMSFVPRHFNFIEHSTNISSEDPVSRNQRISEIIVDPRLYLETRGRMFTADKKREEPRAFKFFTGSEHVILSQKFVEFSVLGWDNLPRRLLLYLTNTKSSHRGYFQTVACNTKEFFNTVINSNLRFNWNNRNVEGSQESKPADFDKILTSGAAFAANFPADDSALDTIDSLALHRARDRISPGGWCLGKQPWWGGDSCEEWGDFDILRPSPAAKRFENMLLKVIANTTLRSNRCHY